MKGKRIISFLLVLCMVFSVIPFSALAVSSWQENRTYLDIENGTLAAGEFYTRLEELIGEPASGTGTIPVVGTSYSWGGDFKYDTTNHDSDGIMSSSTWSYKGTQVKSDSAITPAEGTYYAVRCTDNGKYGDTKSFTVRYYYIPSVTVTGAEGVVATDVTSKVYTGGSVSFTLPAMGSETETWTATVSGLNEAVTLSKDQATTITVPNITSAAQAAITVTLSTVTYQVTQGTHVNPEYGSVTVDKTSGGPGATVTVTATPKESTNSASYYVEKIEVNGTAITGNTFTIGNEDTTVVVTFGAKILSGAASAMVQYNPAKSISSQLDALKQGNLHQTECLFSARGCCLEYS